MISSAEPPARRLLTVEEAALVLALGTTKVYELMGIGALPFVLIGRSRRIPAVAIERFIVDELARQGFTSDTSVSDLPGRLARKRCGLED